MSDKIFFQKFRGNGVVHIDAEHELNVMLNAQLFQPGEEVFCIFDVGFDQLQERINENDTDVEILGQHAAQEAEETIEEQPEEETQE